jgi:hypothetical protein
LITLQQPSRHTEDGIGRLRRVLMWQLSDVRQVI